MWGLIELVAALCGVLDITNCQYVIIWSDLVASGNGWTGYNSFDFSGKSGKCPNAPCTRMAVSNGDSWIENMTNISLYSHIRLQIDLNALDLEHGDTVKYGIILVILFGLNRASMLKDDILINL